MRYQWLKGTVLMWCALVYDITNRESFENIQKVWVPELGTYTSHQNPAVKMVVGNKVDLGDASESGGRVVSKEEGRMLARECGALFLECSAKTRIGVQQVWRKHIWIACLILETESCCVGIWGTVSENSRHTGTVPETTPGISINRKKQCKYSQVKCVGYGRIWRGSMCVLIIYRRFPSTFPVFTFWL